MRPPHSRTLFCLAISLFAFGCASNNNQNVNRASLQIKSNDGLPTAGAKIYYTDSPDAVLIFDQLTNGGDRVTVRRNSFDYSGPLPEALSATTGDDGIAHLAWSGKTIEAVAIGQTGYALISISHADSTQEVRLKPWASVELQMPAESAPTAKVPTMFSEMVPFSTDGGLVVVSGYTEKTSDGRFVISRACAGHLRIYEYLPLDDPPAHGDLVNRWTEWVDVSAGEKSKASLLSSNCELTGKVQIPRGKTAVLSLESWGKFDPPPDAAPVKDLIRYNFQWNNDIKRQYATVAGSDGKFSFEHIVPGKYVLIVTLFGNDAPGVPGKTLLHAIDVPAEGSSVDLGQVE